MGDTGSLALGGIIAVVAILIRKRIIDPCIMESFLIEKLISNYSSRVFQVYKANMVTGNEFLRWLHYIIIIKN